VLITINFEARGIGIIFLGDTGELNTDKVKVAKAIQKYCIKQECNLGLLLGDNFYEFGVKHIDDPQFQTKFEEPYKDLKFKFYPVLGNHDALGNWQAQIDYTSKHWSMPSRFYSLDLHVAKLYAIDTNLYTVANPVQNSSHSQTQHKWITAQLSQNQSPWKIVYGHHPVFSNGLHGDTELLVKNLNPLLDQHKVDFYISGHDHDKELITSNHTKYIICGTGAKLRAITAGSNTIFAKSSLGFGYLHLTATEAIFRFINTNGKVEFEQKYYK